MPVGFTSWTVLPHKPVEKLAPNLWRVSGTMSNGKVQRQMVVARMDDGRLMIHNGIALDDAEMAELEAWGEPAVLVVPNGFHRQDAFIWKQRYPKIQVVAPQGSQKRVGKAVAVDAVVEAAPSDAHVKLLPIPGMPSETVMSVDSDDGVTLVFCDAVMNMPKLGGPMGFFIGPTGQVSLPRAMRWIFVKDKRAFGEAIDGLAKTPRLRRVCFGHGQPVTDGAATSLAAVAQSLR